MRVALTCHYPVDPRFVPGGVTAVAHYLARGLARQPDVDLHVICCQPDVVRDAVEMRDGATVHFLSTSGRFTLLTNAWAEQRKIRAVLDEIEPDVVHAQGLGLTTAGAETSGRPYAVTLHGITWKEASIHHRSWIKEARGKIRARRHLEQIRRARYVFITSGYAARMLPSERSYREFVVNNPIGEEIFEIRNDPAGPHVLVVGGIRHRKDPLTAVRVLERVLEEVPDTNMHLLGPPSRTPLDREVADFVEARGLGRSVKILGLVPDERLHDEYRKASLLLLTSLEETAPIAIGEACAAGIPVVGTDAGGIPYMVREGETGYVRPIGDVDALAERVVAILRDRDLRNRLAVRAREVGREEFDLDRIAQKTVDAYREILAEA